MRQKAPEQETSIGGHRYEPDAEFRVRFYAIRRHLAKPCVTTPVLYVRFLSTLTALSHFLSLRSASHAVVVPCHGAKVSRQRAQYQPPGSEN